MGESLSKNEFQNIMRWAINHRTTVEDYNSITAHDVAHRKRIKELEEAAEKIRDEEGHVCGAYEICNHIACESSYRSWVIANEVLSPKEVKA